VLGYALKVCGRSRVLTVAADVVEVDPVVVRTSRGHPHRQQVARPARAAQPLLRRNRPRRNADAGRPGRRSSTIRGAHWCCARAVFSTPSRTPSRRLNEHAGWGPLGPHRADELGPIEKGPSTAPARRAGSSPAARRSLPRRDRRRMVPSAAMCSTTTRPV
jgi:hypothetical protein